MAEVPRPRLCHIAKWSHFDGYGFNLHAEKAKPGQFIGKVDGGSPAEKAGLKEGDKIVEVNGVNINQENHKQVVQRIKAIPDQTRLLVVDQQAETYHRENGIIVKNTLPYVHHQSSESNNDEVDEVIDTTEQIVINGHGESPEESPQHTPERSPSPEPVATPEPVHNTVTREDSLDLRHSIHSDSIKSNRSSVSSEKELVDMENQDSSANDNNLPSDVDSETNSISTLEQTNEGGSVNSSNIDSYDVNEMPEKISINSRKSQVEDNISITSSKSDKSISETSSLGKQDETSSLGKRDETSSLGKRDETSSLGKQDETNSLGKRDETSSLYNKPFTSQESPHSLSSGSPRSTPSPTNQKNFDGLNLNMTAKEMREMIGSRKKRDPRKDERMDFRKKYEIIQTL